MNYEQLKKDAHALYLKGEIPQWLAVHLMGLKPAKRWPMVKLHEFAQWCVKQALAEVNREVQKETR